MRMNPPDSAKFEVSGPRPSVCTQPRFSIGLGGEQRGLVGRVGDPRRGVVLEPLADRQVDDDGIRASSRSAAGPIPLSSRICGLW